MPMKPLQPFPPPEEYEGKPFMKFHRAVVSELERKGEPLFRIVDASTPYVYLTTSFFVLGQDSNTSRPTHTGTAESASVETTGTDEGGIWRDLEPSYLAQDDDGHWYLSGEGGFARERLAHVGIRRAEWDALPKERREHIISALAAIEVAEAAITLVVKNRHASVRATAERFLHKVSKTLDREQEPGTGVIGAWFSEIAFRAGKRLSEKLEPLLERALKEASGLHHDVLNDSTFQAGHAKEINRVAWEALAPPGFDVEAHIDLPALCKPTDIGHMGKPRRMSARRVADEISARACHLSADALRYDKQRFRSKF